MQKELYVLVPNGVRDHSIFKELKEIQCYSNTECEGQEAGDESLQDMLGSENLIL